ncbi:MAG: type II secretion system protein [Phycisphaerales bacterium]
MRPTPPFDADPRPHATPAFTLVELLVTTAIVITLIAILIPVLRGAREAARSAKCASNLHQLALGCAAYATDRRVLPVRTTESNLAVTLEMHPELWDCPSNDGIEGVPIDSYFYPASGIAFLNPSGSGNVNRWDIVTRAFEQNPRLPLIHDMWVWHGFRNVAGFDGAITRDFEHNMEIVAIDPNGGR